MWFLAITYLAFLRFMAYIFFGGLRGIELEHLIEKSSISMTDTFIILILMHSKFDKNLIKPFLILYLSKWTKWILEDRLGYVIIYLDLF